MNARRQLSRILLAGSLVALGAGVQPSVAAGQASQIASIEAERRLDYQAAADAYESALAARAAAQSRFSRLTEEIAAARRAGDEDRRDRALAEVQSISVEMLSLDQRVEETAETLGLARASFLDALDAHLELLDTQIALALTAADSTDLVAMYRNVRTELGEIETDSRGELRLVPVVMPEVTAEPRDGPLELSLKAELLEEEGGAGRLGDRRPGPRGRRAGAAGTPGPRSP